MRASELYPTITIDKISIRTEPDRSCACSYFQKFSGHSNQKKRYDMKTTKTFIWNRVTEKSHITCILLYLTEQLLMTCERDES